MPHLRIQYAAAIPTRNATVIELAGATTTMSGMIVPKLPNAPESSESENFGAGFSTVVIRS